QTSFYFGLNAPAEELFWRGTVQALAEKGVARLPRMQMAAPWLAWLFATATFGVYHRLGNWSWRSIAGVTVAGGFFGALYQLQRRPRSLLAPVLVHGFATAGFLSWGDVYLHLLKRYGQPMV
ncbi:MAG TPA: CPBP family intramembrane glutamic endopeptidase, partial [Ktedonobacterales bacterium]|nr:CPBP family intramembrane glutamic endopeptidase [Ktedonobacterales bacterium]